MPLIQYYVPLLLYFIQLSQSLQCFETVYPRVLGGTNANTDIYSFDFDSNSNLVFSGGTSDTSIQSGGGTDANPVVSYLSSGGVYLWEKQFSPNTLANAIIVKFNTLATKVVVVFDSSFEFVTLNASTGSIIYSYSASQAISTSSGALIIDSSDNIYLGVSSLTIWGVVKLSMAAPSVISVWGYSAGLVGGQAFSLVFGESQSVIYVGGLIMSVFSYQSLTRMQTSTGTINWHYAQGGLLNYYEMTSITFATFSSVNYVYGCSQGVGGYSAYIGLTKFTMTGTNTVSSSASYLDSSSSSNAYCRGIYVRDAYSIYNIIYYSSGNIHYTFTDLTLANPKIYHTLISQVSGTNTIANFAYFKTETSVYFGGQLKTVSGASPVQTFSYYVGFIMTYDSAQSCLTLTYTTTNLVLTANAFSYSSLSPLMLTISMSFASAGITNSNTVSSGSISSSSWCTSQSVTLTASYIASSTTYVVGSSATTLTFTAFQVSPYCSDTVFTYTATQSSLAALPSSIVFSATSQSFTISTSSNSNAGTYTIVLTGTVPTSQSISTTFTVIIASSCSIATVTSSTIPSISYLIPTSSTQSTVFPAFSISDSSCTITYTMTLDSGSAYDSTVITSFTSSSRTILISTSNSAKVGTYSLRVKGTVTGYTNYATSTFVLTISVDCTQSTMSTSSIAAYTYDINSGSAATIATLAWTQLYTSACASITYALYKSDGTTADSSVVYLSGTSIIVQTNQASKVGTYNLKVIGSVSTYTSASVTFTLTVVQGCASTVITPSSISTYTYDIDSGTTGTIATLAWTQSQSSCGSITYVLKNSDGSTADSSVVYLSGSSIYVSTSSASKIGTYSLKVTGSVSSYTSTTVYFTLNVVEACASIVITPTAISSYTYDINSGTSATIATLSWSVSISSCPSITYVLKNSDGTTADSSVVTLTGSVVSVSTSSVAKVGTYNLKVIGSVSTFTSQTEVFTLYVVQGCTSTVITSTSISTYSYDINSGTQQTIATLAWTQSQPSCPSITYALKNQDGTSADTSVVTISSSTIYVQTSSALKIGTYSLEVIGSVSTYTSKTVTFTLVVNQGCSSTVITSTPISTYTYDINSGTQATVATLAWTQSQTACPSITYLLLNQDGTTADSSVVNMSGSSIYVQTSSALNVGAYNLKVIGSVSTYTSQTVTFQLIVTQGCSSTVITSTPISTYSYDINSGTQQTIVTLAWTQSLTSCPSITYVLKNQDGTSSDSTVVTLNGNQVQVQTSSTLKLGTYNLEVIGSVSSYTSKTVTFSLIVTQGCSSTVISSTSISTYSYDINSGTQQTIATLVWTQSQSSCPSITYVLQNQDGTPSDSTVIYLSGTSIYVQTSSVLKVGTYNLEVVGSVSTYTQATITFSLVVYQSCSSTVITSTPISTYSYDINSGTTNTIATLAWTQSQTSCPSITYVLQNQDGTTADSSVVYLSGSSIMVYTTSSLKVATYSLEIVGSVSTFTSSTVQFTLKVVEGCASTTITSNPILTYTYDINEGTQDTIATLAWTQSLSSCPSITYVLMNQDGSSADSTVVTLTGSTLKVQTSLASKVGTYSLQIIGSVSTYTTSSVTFTLYVVDGCSSTVISSSPISTYSYDINSGVQNTIATLAWTQSSSPCPSITYVLQNQDGTSADSSVVSLSGSLIEVQTSSTSKIGTYNLEIIGSVQTFTTVTQTFTLIVYQGCSTTVITTSSIPTYTYDVNVGDLETIQTLAWTQSQTSCPSITYALFNQDGSAADSSVIYMSGSNIEVQTSLASKVGTYNLKIVGSVSSYTSAGVQFTLIVEQSCLSTIITSSAIPDFTYDINSGTLESVATLDWTQSQISCPSITYSLANSDGSSLDTSVVNLNGNLIQVQTPLVSKEGTYSLTITGSVSTFTSTSVTFTLYVIQSCSTTTITPTPIPTYTYDIANGLSEIADLQWTQSQPSCGTITYALQTQDGSTLSSFIYLSNSYIYVQTSSESNQGTYQLEVIASIGSYTSYTLQFTLIITAGCSEGTVTPSTISNQQYQVGVVALVVQFNAWISSITPCGNFVYSALSNGNALPSYIAFDSILREFSVYTTSTSDSGIYIIDITGTLTTGPSASITFTIQIINPCSSATFINTTISDLTYYVGTASQLLPLNVFASSESSTICGSFVYSLTYEDGSPIDTSIFTFDSSTPSLSIYSTVASTINTYYFALQAYQGSYSANMITTYFQISIQDSCSSMTLTTPSPLTAVYDVAQSAKIISILSFTPSLSSCGNIKYTCKNSDNTTLDSSLFTFNSDTLQLRVYTNDYTKVGKYYLSVIGTIPGYVSSSMALNLTISTGCEQTAIKITSIQNQYYSIGKQLKIITFNSWVPSDSLCGIYLEYTASLQNNSAMPSFISFNSSQRLFVIFTNNSNDAGSYEIQITGSDPSFQIQVSTTFILTIPVSNFSDSYDPSFNNSQAGSQSSTSSFLNTFPNFGQNQQQFNQLFMNASILNISGLGVVRVQFSDQILLYPNFNLINDQQMLITISNQRSYLIKDWQIIEFGNQYINIQLNFTDPTQITPSDILTINFIDDTVFYSINMMKQLPPHYQISKSLPVQFSSQQDEIAAQGIASALANAFAILSSCSFVVQIILNGSLAMMWGLVNTLQLLVYVPIFTISIPSNLSIILAQIVNLINFNYFDLSSVETEILFLEANYTTYNENFNFVGYQSSNYVLNMGFGLCTIYLYPFLFLAFILLRKLNIKLATRGSGFLKRFLIYNGTLRYFIESTIEICTSAMIQILMPNPYKEAGDIISLTIGIIMLCITLSLVFIPAFLIRNKEALEEESFKHKYSELYEGINTEYNSCLIFLSFYFIRRFGFLALAFAVPDVPGIQVCGFLLLNVCTIVYLVAVRPFEEKARQSMEVFNEVCHILASYCLYGFTDFLSDTTSQYQAGWVYSGILGMNFLTNTVIIAYGVILSIRLNIKRFRRYLSRKNKSKVQILPIDKLQNSFMKQTTPMVKNMVKEQDQNRLSVIVNSSSQKQLQTIFEVGDIEEDYSPAKIPTPTESSISSPITDQSKSIQNESPLFQERKFCESVEVEQKRRESVNGNYQDLNFVRMLSLNSSFNQHSQAPVSHVSQKALDYSHIQPTRYKQKSHSSQQLQFQEMGLRMRTLEYMPKMNLNVMHNNFELFDKDLLDEESKGEKSIDNESISDGGSESSNNFSGPNSDEKRMNASDQSSVALKISDKSMNFSRFKKQSINVVVDNNLSLFKRNQLQLKRNHGSSQLGGSSKFLDYNK